MTDAMKKRLLAVGAVLVASTALGWVSMADLGENLVYYWTPTQLMENKSKATDEAIVRLGGMVVDGTFEWTPEEQLATFDVTDGDTTVHVRSTGTPPQMFREGIGVVVEGSLSSAEVFETEKIMVKHSNEYEAPEGEIRVEDMYKEMAKQQ
jgi:cytochrome c-type biogenesis protein CcmE